MDKTSQEVTKDKVPKRVDAGLKGRGSFMKEMKENILNDAKKGSRDTNNSSNETTSAWCPCKKLCSLQKMDQLVIQQQNFIALLRAIKLHNTQCRFILREASWRPAHLSTFQLLRYH